MKKYIRTSLAVGVIVLLTIILHYAGWLSPVENFFRSIISPASGVVYDISLNVSGESETFSSSVELADAYKELKEDYLKNLVDQSKLLRLESENEVLRGQLSFFNETGFQHVTARVFGKNIDPLGSTILIDKGEEHQISIGDAVVVGEGVLVGLIAEVEKDSSIVRLVNDSQSRVAATILNHDKSIGLVEGGFAINVQMNFIPQSEQINPGDLIVTTGLSQDIPAGLLIGSVEVVQKEVYEPFQKAIISPAENLQKLSVVSVIVNK